MGKNYIDRDVAICRLTNLEVSNKNSTITNAKRILADMDSLTICSGCKYCDQSSPYIYCKKLKMECPDDSEFFCKYGLPKVAL